MIFRHNAKKFNRILIFGHRINISHSSSQHLLKSIKGKVAKSTSQSIGKNPDFTPNRLSINIDTNRASTERLTRYSCLCATAWANAGVPQPLSPQPAS
jgi:hypothetical protein